MPPPSKLLEADLARAMTIEELSQQVGISATQLRADFKEQMGIPLGHYRIRQSLVAAHHLIENELLTVAETMERNGFHNLNRFDKAFKEAYGMNPGEFRYQCLLRKFSSTS